MCLPSRSRVRTRWGFFQFIVGRLEPWRTISGWTKFPWSCSLSLLWLCANLKSKFPYWTFSAHSPALVPGPKRNLLPSSMLLSPSPRKSSTSSYPHFHSTWKCMCMWPLGGWPWILSQKTKARSWFPLHDRS
jgi:hypothetical protein